MCCFQGPGACFALNRHGCLTPNDRQVHNKFNELEKDKAATAMEDGQLLPAEVTAELQMRLERMVTRRAAADNERAKSERLARQRMQPVRALAIKFPR